MIRKRSPSLRVGALGIIGLVLLVTGCSTSTGGSSPSVSGATSASSATAVDAASTAAAVFQKPPTSINVKTPLAKAPTAGTKAAYLAAGNPANQLAGKSACAALVSVGWICDTLTYDASNPASFQAAVNTALQKGAKYLMEDGSPPSLLGPSTLRAICSSGAHLIAASVYPDATSGCVNTVANGGPARTQFATALAMWFIDDSKGKGHALVSTISEYPILYWFATEFQRVVQANCPNCRVDIKKFTAADLGNGAVVPGVVSALRADSTINYAIFDYSAFSTGIVAALASAGITSVKVAGTGLDANALAELKKGTEAAWVAQSWFQEGYEMADVSLRLETGSSGISEDAVAPLELITPQNTADVNGANSEWNQPADALAQFQKLWKVG